MASVVRDHARGVAVAIAKAEGNHNPDALFELAVAFPVVRVRLQDFARLPIGLGARAPSQKAKTLRPEVKLPVKDPKTVLFFAHAVVKKAIPLRIARFQAMTGRDREKI